MKQWQYNPADDEEFFDDDDDFYEDEYGLDDEYTGFEKIPHKKYGEEEPKSGKKRSSVKHQKRPDKE